MRGGEQRRPPHGQGQGCGCRPSRRRAFVEMYLHAFDLPPWQEGSSSSGEPRPRLQHTCSPNEQVRLVRCSVRFAGEGGCCRQGLSSLSHFPFNHAVFAPAAQMFCTRAKACANRACKALLHGRQGWASGQSPARRIGAQASRLLLRRAGAVRLLLRYNAPIDPNSYLRSKKL